MELSQIFRIEDGVAFTPTITLKKKKRTVVLIGMCHIAEKRFFQEVQLLLNSFEVCGFQVMYEDEILCFGSSPDEKQMKLQYKLNFKQKMFGKKLRKLGLAYQTDHIHKGPNWLSADFSPKDWEREVPQLLSRFHAAVWRVSRIDRLVDHPEISLRNFKLMETNPPSEINTETGIGRDLVGKRDAFATLKILEHTSCRNVVAHWGAAHLPGISEKLIDRGFVVDNIQWVRVMDLKKIKAERG